MTKPRLPLLFDYSVHSSPFTRWQNQKPKAPSLSLQRSRRKKEKTTSSFPMLFSLPTMATHSSFLSSLPVNLSLRKLICLFSLPFDQTKANSSSLPFSPPSSTAKTQPFYGLTAPLFFFCQSRICSLSCCKILSSHAKSPKNRSARLKKNATRESPLHMCGTVWYLSFSN